MSKQQDLFQAVCDLLGWSTSSLTPTVRSRVGKVAKELGEAGATPEEILWAREAWRRMWGSGEDQPTLTDTALISWWPEIHRRYEARQRAREQAQEAKGFAVKLPDDHVLLEDGRIVKALPIEENRRRWQEMMKGLSTSTSSLLKEI